MRSISMGFCIVVAGVLLLSSCEHPGHYTEDAEARKFVDAVVERMVQSPSSGSNVYLVRNIECCGESWTVSKLGKTREKREERFNLSKNIIQYFPEEIKALTQNVGPYFWEGLSKAKYKHTEELKELFRMDKRHFELLGSLTRQEWSQLVEHRGNALQAVDSFNQVPESVIFVESEQWRSYVEESNIVIGLLMHHGFTLEELGVKDEHRRYIPFRTGNRIGYKIDLLIRRQNGEGDIARQARYYAELVDIVLSSAP